MAANADRDVQDVQGIQAICVLWDAHKTSGKTLRAAATAYLERLVVDRDISLTHANHEDHQYDGCGSLETLLYEGAGAWESGPLRFTVRDGMCMLTGGKVKKGVFTYWIERHEPDAHVLSAEAASMFQDIIGHSAAGITWASFFPDGRTAFLEKQARWRALQREMEKAPPQVDSVGDIVCRMLRQTPGE